MFSERKLFIKKLESINAKINENLDYDFSAVSKHVETMDEFNKLIMQDFKNGRQLFYRGERVNDKSRHLLPTMLRNSKDFSSDNDLGIVHFDSQFLLDYYSGLGNFVNVFSSTMGKVDVDNLYEICAFAQHYCHFSPLIDFTKSVYPSLSFALKNRKVYEDDIVLYTLELKNTGDYTNDISIANRWLKNLSVYACHFDEKYLKKAIKEMINNKQITSIPEDFKIHLENLTSLPSPQARLIDVPTNTRMKFQQGVFLLLTDFHFTNTYFTKSVRDQFAITKFIISKDICPDILKMINEDTPWYSYKYLMDVEGAFKEAINDCNTQ